MKICMCFKSVTDYKLPQEDPNRLFLCGGKETLNLKLNLTKFQVISFILSSNFLDYDYKIHGLSVTRSGISVYDFGFRLSRNLGSPLW